MGQSRVFQSAYFWIVAVPLVARIIDRFQLHIDMPFSWRMFFLSALATSLANVLFLWKAPVFVRRFDTFTEYVAEGRSARELSRWFQQLLQRHGQQLTGNEWNNVVQYARIADAESDATVPSDTESAIAAIEAVDMPEAMGSQAFWHIHRLGDDMHRNFRFATTGAYGVGLALFGIVIGQNVWFVLEPWVKEVIGYVGGG